jgi:type IV pilus assembly protein PilV
MKGGRAPAGRRAIGGSSLIEVLIAVLLLSVAVLGMALTQATVLRRSQGSQQRTTAVLAGISLGEAMRANRAASLRGEYQTDGMRCASAGPLPGDSLAQRDLHAWIDALRQGIGDGDDVCGQVRCDNRVCQVRVSWNDARAEAAHVPAPVVVDLGIAP